MAEKGHTETKPLFFERATSLGNAEIHDNNGSDFSFRFVGAGSIKKQNEIGKLIVTAVNTYPAVEGMVKAVSDLLHWAEPIAGDNRDDAAAANEVLTVEQVKTALSRFRSLQNGGAND